jgi:hypothetical protein
MAPSGFVSTWLPLQQEHSTGREAHFDLLRGDIHRGPMWTDNDKAPGDLAMSPWQQLPPGDYTAVLQLFSPESSKARVGTLLAENESGQCLAEQAVSPRGQDHGDWQRELIAFRLAAPTRVRVRFRYDGSLPLWTGTLHLTRSGPRPLYIIGHNRNTPEQVERSLEKGANAIEGDFSYREGKLMVAETPPYPGWLEISEPHAWLSYLQARKSRWAFLYIDCKLDKVPGDDFYRYGRELGELVLATGIDPRSCLFNAPDLRGRDLFRGIADAGFGASATGVDGLHKSQPREAPPDLWAKTAQEFRFSFMGLGRPSYDFTTPLALWWSALRETTVARDTASGYPNKIIYWSLDDKDGMRKVLDLGVDGIIVDHEDRLCQVLEEQPYRQFCRRAAPSDWEPLKAHGIDD